MNKQVDNFNKFCKRFNVIVSESRKRYYTSNPFNAFDQTASEFISPVPVPGVQLDMPNSEFEALVHAESIFEQDFLSNRWRGTGVERFWAQHLDEVRLRAEHPGLQEAWEKYQMLVRLTAKKSVY